MILQCKNCNARYLVPDSSIGATGRTVRCGWCNSSWFEEPVLKPAGGEISEQAPDFDTMIENINAAPKPLPPGSNLPVHMEKTPVGLKVVAASLAIVAVILALFMTTPWLFGIVPSKGLVLADIKIQKKGDENSRIVEVNGNILNASEDPHVIPNIKIILLDGANNPLQSWEFKSNGATLKSKETMPFTSGDLNMKFSIAKRFVIDMGTPMELALRRKPQ